MEKWAKSRKISMQSSRPGISRQRLAGQEGYLLVAVMLLIAVMLIAMAVEAPRISQQIKREKEEELVHRGKEYAIAIKKYYHKVGTYPVSLDQLESTNNLRFLRQRFKDPMTASGEWKLIHLGEAQITIPTGGTPGSTGTLNSSPLGGAATPSPTPGGLGTGSGLSSGGLGTGSGSSGGLQSGNQPGAGGTMGTLNTSNIGTGLGGNSQGGGPIIGVASTSTKTSIKEFNGNAEYDQWLFVYDPRLEQAPGSNGIVIASPRSASSPATGTPAGGAPGAPGAPPVPGTTPVPTPSPQSVPQ
jgi:type II secretory pathway pseudopilin PulG